MARANQFQTAEDAYQWAMSGGMSFDADGYLITAGCEGCGRETWRLIQDAADIIAESLPFRQPNGPGIGID